MSEDIDTILPAVTMQRPRCDCCPPLVVTFGGTAVSASLAMAGFVTTPDKTVFFLHTNHGNNAEMVDYNPRTGLFSPATYSVGGGTASYASPVSTSAADATSSYDTALLETILTERIAASSAGTVSTGIIRSTSSFHTTAGNGNYIYNDPPTGGGEYVAEEHDEFTNDPSTYQTAARREIKHFKFHVDLPRPHISGSYRIEYRWVTRTTVVTVHVKNYLGGSAGPRQERVTITNSDTYAFGETTALTLTPSAGYTFVESGEIAWPDAGIGERITLVGPPGKPGIGFFGGSVGGSAGKSGFIERVHDVTDGLPIGVYLTEQASGARRGGMQTWDPTSSDPLTLAFTGPNPEGSPQFPDDMASLVWPDGLYGDWPLVGPTPVSLTRLTADFSLQGESSALHFLLSNEFTTDDLKAPIDALIDAEEPVIQGGFLCEQYLSEYETWYKKHIGYVNFALSLTAPITTDTTTETQDFLDLSDDWTATFSAQWDQVTIGPSGSETVDGHAHSVTFTPDLTFLSYPANGEDGSKNYLQINPPDNSRVVIRNVRMTPATNERICPPVLAYSI